MKRPPQTPRSLIAHAPTSKTLPVKRMDLPAIKKRLPAHRRPHDPLTPELATVGSAADLLEVDERRRRVQAAILSLPHEYRQVIVLRHFSELSYDEIAEAVGVPARTVKSRLHTARERLGQI